MNPAHKALAIGLVIVPVAMFAGCSGGQKQRSSVDTQINNAKLFVADLKQTFEAGGTEKVTQGSEGRDTRKDARMAILGLILSDKIRFTVINKVTDPQRRQGALTKLEQINKYFNDTILPQFDTAVRSKKPEEAKAMVPLLNNLDQQLDELNEILG